MQRAVRWLAVQLNGEKGYDQRDEDARPIRPRR